MKTLFVINILSFERSTADKLLEANSEINCSVSFRNSNGKTIWISIESKRQNHLNQTVQMNKKINLAVVYLIR